MEHRDYLFSDFNGFAQGTTYRIIYKDIGKIHPMELKNNIENILYDFDMSLSLYQDSSVVSRINRNEDVIPDAYFIKVFQRAKEIYALTGGAFDATIGPLVKAWGFGPDAQKNFTETKRDSLTKLIGMEKIELMNGQIVKSDPKIMLDFNAIAKGYAVDVISGFLDDQEIDSYLVEIGGEVRTRGDKDGSYWRIGIDRPEDNNMIPGNNTQAVIRIRDRSLATSGNYRKFFVENSIKYSHTINPRTGYPIRNSLLSVTILADDCASADGIATACMVMGKDKAIEFMRNNPHLDAYIIFLGKAGNFQSCFTDNLKNKL